MALNGIPIISIVCQRIFVHKVDSLIWMSVRDAVVCLLLEWRVFGNSASH